MRTFLLILITSLWTLGCMERETVSPEGDHHLADTIPADTVDHDSVATDAPAGDSTRLTLILDTDIAEDCDDVGAMAVLHALANLGEVDILGMMVSMPVDYGAPALDAINTWYKRPDIPIGTLKNSRDGADQGDDLLVYNKALATQFPNDLEHARNAPNAVDLYRQLLAGEPDESVVILTVGPLTNLYHLMKSGPDAHSTLDGMELIRRKVKRFVMAGGNLPEGTSYNFRISPEKSEYVINNWPTEHWLVPNALGGDVMTGTELLQQTASDNPIHVAYALYRKAHPGWEFRPSWDQMGVYVAVRGVGDLFKTNTTGSVKAYRQTIKWSTSPDTNHVWFQNNASVEKRRRTIEGLMMRE